MLGLMMDEPLLISSILRHAETVHGDQQVVSRTVEGSIHRYGYADLARRSRQLANALTDLGIGRGDRVGTIAWNTHRHLELYYGVSGMGAVCHTLNPRLTPDQLAWIVNHAEDGVLCIDSTFVPLAQAIAGRIPTVRHIVVLTDREHMPAELGGALCYEDLINGHGDGFDWPRLDERTASALCYTSGTTGDPKGVLYSHRSTVLHAFGISLPAALPVGEGDALLPVVPHFHVLAWGLPYAVPMNGGRLVMPGPRLDGASLTELMAAEGVTVAAGVPTVWHGLLQHWRDAGAGVDSLKRLVVGGSAAPPAMIRAFETEYDIRFIHAWGMTETSPVGTASSVKPGLADDDPEARIRLKAKQGRPVFGVELAIADEAGRPLPWDGAAFGELKVRGPWVCSGYFKLDRSPQHAADGWFATGDVATIDANAYLQITDRTKDLIKSGGEWVSSIELENLAMNHPDIAQAAAIAVPDEKWGERPLLIVVPKAGAAPDKQGVLDHVARSVAKWQVPDDVVFVDSLPLGATGKVLKTRLREMYGAGSAGQAAD